MRRIFTILLLVSYISVLGIAVSEMPRFGDPDNPVHNEISRRYIEDGVRDTGTLNLVSAILADYRAFDTLGEVTVLLTGVAGLLVVLSLKTKKE